MRTNGWLTTHHLVHFFIKLAGLPVSLLLSYKSLYLFVTLLGSPGVIYLLHFSQDLSYTLQLCSHPSSCSCIACSPHISINFAVSLSFHCAIVLFDSPDEAHELLRMCSLVIWHGYVKELVPVQVMEACWATCLSSAR